MGRLYTMEIVQLVTQITQWFSTARLKPFRASKMTLTAMKCSYVCRHFRTFLLSHQKEAKYTVTTKPYLPGIQTGMTRPLSTTESPTFRLQVMSPSHSRPRCSCWTITSLLSKEFVSKSDFPATSFMLKPKNRSLERFIYCEHKYTMILRSLGNLEPGNSEHPFPIYCTMCMTA